jgi:hypothetical protein
MKVDSNALQEILDRTLREVAQKAIFARRALQPFNLTLAGHTARARVTSAIALVELDKVITAGRGHYKVSSSIEGVAPSSVASYDVFRGMGCQRPACDLPVHCTCADHRNRGVRCKHTLAVGLYLRSGGAK